MIDYTLVALPIIMTNATPDYIIHIYLISFAIIGILICISEIDGKGRIAINILKENNPRLPYNKFENRKISDLIL